jgi:hypothetical protein
VTKSEGNQRDKGKPLTGGVQHDARGNAVWHWASETARHAAATTSQLLRRLDVASLSLEDEQPPKAHSKTALPPSKHTSTPAPRPASKPAAPQRAAQAGFNPYAGAAAPSANAARNRPAASAAARSSWWRRLLQRR